MKKVSGVISTASGALVVGGVRDIYIYIYIYMMYPEIGLSALVVGGVSDTYIPSIHPGDSFECSME